MVPENRRLFAPMTVRENLELGRLPAHDGGETEDFERVFTLFPRVYERRAQQAGTLSGGEQQMVAMGRALMARPQAPADGRAVDGARADPRRAAASS